MKLVKVGDMEVEIYPEVINPFTAKVAKEFVWLHRNVFSRSTVKKVVYESENLIIIEEISHLELLKSVWYWGFSRRARGIISDITNSPQVVKQLNTKQIVKIFEKVLL